MKVSDIVNILVVLHCPLMDQDGWDPAGYTQYLRILNEKGALTPKATPDKKAKVTKAKYLTDPKAKAAKYPKYL